MATLCSFRGCGVLILWLLFENVILVHGGESCGRPGREEYCEHGCCGSGDSEECCAISTSVLIVACAVSGLVFIALVAAIVICCYKNYKDNQANRVRRLQQEQAFNEPRVPGVEPRKPPEYISAPPEYSEEMPESHYRPPTVSGHVVFNQRYSSTVPGQQRNISITRTSGSHPIDRTESIRGSHIPGTVRSEQPSQRRAIPEAPPPYSEYARGLTPANSRQEAIEIENNNRNNLRSSVTNESIRSSNADATPRRRAFIQTQLQNETIEEIEASSTSVTDTSASTSRVLSTREQDSRSVSTHEQESRSMSSFDQESRVETRAESVARVLRSARTPRARTQPRNSTLRNEATPFVLQSGDNISEESLREDNSTVESGPPGAVAPTRNRNNPMIDDLAVI